MIESALISRLGMLSSLWVSWAKNSLKCCLQSFACCFLQYPPMWVRKPWIPLNPRWWQHGHSRIIFVRIGNQTYWNQAIATDASFVVLHTEIPAVIMKQLLAFQTIVCWRSTISAKGTLPLRKQILFISRCTWSIWTVNSAPFCHSTLSWLNIQIGFTFVIYSSFKLDRLFLMNSVFSPWMFLTFLRGVVVVDQSDVSPTLNDQSLVSTWIDSYTSHPW